MGEAIGVLGGMGPESTAYVYMQMIRFCQVEYVAKLDSDFPPIIVYSLPVPDVVELGASETEVFAALRNGLSKLKAAGASFSFIACNSMQKFVPELRKEYELLSIIEETVAEAKRLGVNQIGLLATETTIASGCYQSAFADAKIDMLLPKRQNEVTLTIREILEGRKEEPKARLLAIAGELKNAGAMAIVLGCTDLPIVLSQRDVQLPILDTAAIIGRAAIRKYLQMVPKDKAI